LDGSSTVFLGSSTSDATPVLCTEVCSATLENKSTANMLTNTRWSGGASAENLTTRRDRKVTFFRIEEVKQLFNASTPVLTCDDQLTWLLLQPF
jgi:hypothetical protein